MPITEADIISKIKKIKPKDAFYPAFTIIATIIFAVIFIMSVKFIFNSVNIVFRDEGDYQLIRFDLASFSKVAGRLGINI